MFTSMALQQMWARAWPIISLLLGCSILSGAIILERWFSLGRAAFNRDVFLGKLEKFLTDGRFEQATVYCESMKKPIGRVVGMVLEVAQKHRPVDRERLERVTNRLVRSETSGLASNLTVLGTIGSVSPFVGLFGTVVGIIHAFRAISENAGGGPGVVANGIAEALITTALGLFVAIPAIVAYNLYTRKIERISEDIQLTSEEVIDWLAPR
jgi:biopolymer transport protein ExbB/TolQ